MPSKLEEVEENQVKRFKEYSLAGVFPENGKVYVLSLDNEYEYLSLTINGHVVQVCGIPYSEYLLFEALVEQHPYYASRELLLSKTNGLSVEDCLDAIEQAETDKDVRIATAPVINIISRLRMRLIPFGIHIDTWVETGYILRPLSNKRAAILKRRKQRR